MEEEEILISKKGLENLKETLHKLEEKSKAVAERISDARELGDLSENAEYHEAKREQSFLFGKIKDLKYKIDHAKVVEKSGKNDKVEIGSKLTLLCDGEREEITLVGGEESDPLKGLVSVNSPIGSALLSKSQGEEVKVKTPGGSVKYKILEIS